MQNNEVTLETCDTYLYHSGGLVNWLTEIAHVVVSLVSVTDGIVLDLGCGSGAHFPYYKQGQKVIAVDFDSVMLERASSNTKDSIQLVQADITKGLPLEDNSIDYCIASGVLEHLPDLNCTNLPARRNELCRLARTRNKDTCTTMDLSDIRRD